jgi:putative isomerase
MQGAKTGNPSNWQGPIWIVSNYLVFRALMNYGRREEAEKLYERSVNILTKDIRQSGTMHEYYHAETGQPIHNPDFLNWNLLVLTMQRELDTGIVDFAV